MLSNKKSESSPEVVIKEANCLKCDKICHQKITFTTAKRH